MNVSVAYIAGLFDGEGCIASQCHVHDRRMDIHEELKRLKHQYGHSVS